MTTLTATLHDHGRKARRDAFAPPRGEAIRRRLVQEFRAQRRRALAALEPGRKDAGDGLPEEWPDFELGSLAMSERMTPLLRVLWERGGGALFGRLGLDPDAWKVVNPFTAAKVQRAALAFCEATNRTTTQALDAALERTRRELAAGLVTRGESVEKLTRRVNGVFDLAEKWRARRIAQSEASRAVHAGTEAAAVESQMVVGFRWLVSTDACPLCQTVARRAPCVPLGQPFAIVGRHPVYSEVRHPPLHPHCNCSMTEVLRPEVSGEPLPEWSPTLVQPVPEAADHPDGQAPPRRARRPLGAGGAAGGPANPPRFGPSRAAVVFGQGGEDGPKARREVLAAARELVGRDVTARDLASLAGAPDAAEVRSFTYGQGPSRRVGWHVDLPGVLKASAQFRRTPLGLVLSNDEVAVDKEWRGRGVASRLIARQVEAMDRLGFRMARLAAARNDGPDPELVRTGYRVWPSFGYDAPIPDDLRRELPDALRDAATVLDLYASPEGAAWWARHGRSILMEFDMAEAGRSRAVLDAKLASLAARGELKRAPSSQSEFPFMGKAGEPNTTDPSRWPFPGREPYCDPGEDYTDEEFQAHCREVFGWDR